MMMRRTTVSCAIAFALAATSALAQTEGGPWTKTTEMGLARVEGYITKAAEQVSEANYAFKPTPDVRSFGQLVGHVADANHMFCAMAAGEKPPTESVEKTKTAKADLQKALGESFAYCHKVLAAMTDAKGAEMVAFFGNQIPKLGLLGINTAHDFEHYGNIVTYMRIKGQVPPSSQPGGM
jgi:uncharacterized damage-inducible protein DinB